MTEHLLQKYGFERKCHGVHGTDIPVLNLENSSAQTMQCLEETALRALQSDKSSAIVLGCAGMAPLCEQLSKRLGVPVIDGVAAAVRLCEASVDGATTSSRTGGYEYPLSKIYTGWAQSISP